MRKLIYILVAALSFCACEHTFDIDKYIGDSKVYMSFAPSNDYDSTYFYIQATTPMNDSRNPRVSKNESIVVKVNGQEITLEKLGKIGGEYGPIAYVTTKKFSSGDKVEIEGELDGTVRSRGECTVPPSFPKYSIKSRIETIDSYDQIVFDLSYDNDKSNTGYYGIEVVVQTKGTSTYGVQKEDGTIEWGEPEINYYESSESPETAYDFTLSTAGQDPMTFVPNKINYQYVRKGWYYSQYHQVLAWSDIPEKAGEKGFQQIRVGFNEPREDEYEYYDSNYYDYNEEYDYWYYNPDTYDGPIYWRKIQYEYKYKLVLYSFSDSMFKSLKAAYNVTNGADFASMGLAPASFTYTNIKNGLGVCGSYIVSETDWMEITK